MSKHSDSLHVFIHINTQYYFFPSVEIAYHAALRGERLLSSCHELTERHVQSSPAGGATGSACT